MKLLGHSQNGEMLKFEDSSNPKGYTWYFLAPNVKPFAKNLKEGADIEVKVEERNGQDTIVFLKASGAVSSTSAGSASGGGGTGYQKSTYGKSPEEQDSIKRQAMMKTAGDAIATCMQGQLDVNALGDQICILYEKLYAKINE